MVLPMPFALPAGGEEVVRGKRWFIIPIMVVLVVCLPFLFMTADFTVGSGVMQIFILVFGGLTLWTNDLAQMVPWALLAFFEFIFALVSIILRAVRGAGDAELFGGDNWVRKDLAYGFEIANAVTLLLIILLTIWTWYDVKRLMGTAPAAAAPFANQGGDQEEGSPANGIHGYGSPSNPRQQSSFRAFSGVGNRLSDTATA